jgi:hypothetical protein
MPAVHITTGARQRPRFQKRHYQLLADAIRSTRVLPHDSAQEAMADLIEDLVSRFALDNPDFNPDTFRRAAQERSR